MIYFLLFLLLYTPVLCAGWFLSAFFHKTAELHGRPSWACEIAGIVGWLIPFALVHSLLR